MTDLLKNSDGKFDFYRVLALIALLAVLYFGYELTVAQPTRNRQLTEEKMRQEQLQEDRKRVDAQLEASARQEALDSCLFDASFTYDSNWEKSCDELGKESDCGLPTVTAKRWDDFREQDEAQCHQRYGS
jgi:hypothetical protein